MSSHDDFVHKQENLPNECYKIYRDMRQEKEFCDVKLNVGNHCIHAHKVILAASIPYFRSFFGCNDTEDHTKEIPLSDVSLEALEALVNFAYTCEVKITSENVHALLTAACFLHVECVKKACVEFLISGLSPADALTVRDIGVRLKCVDLVNKTDDYIKENFDDLSQVEGFLFLQYLDLKNLISSDNLHVTSEEKVFEGVIRWVKAQPEERTVELPSLLSCVRMPFLKLQYLQDVIGTDNLIRKSLECRDILDDARDYHFFLEKKCGAKNTWRFSCVPRQYKNVKSRKACPVMNGETWVSGLHPKLQGVYQTKLSQDWANNVSDFNSEVPISWHQMECASKNSANTCLRAEKSRPSVNSHHVISRVPGCHEAKCSEDRTNISHFCSGIQSRVEYANNNSNYPLYRQHSTVDSNSRDEFEKSGNKPVNNKSYQGTTYLRSYSNEKLYSEIPLRENLLVRGMWFSEANQENYSSVPLPYIRYHPSIDSSANQNLFKYMP